MKIISTLEQTHNDSTIIESNDIGFGDTFNINPYSGVSYSSNDNDNYMIGIGLRDKYLVHANISYTGTAGSIYPSMYVQIIPNDKSSKIEYTQSPFETYSGAALNIYKDDNYIMFRYRRLDLSYGYRRLVLSTGIRSDIDGEPTGSIMPATGVSFNGYNATASLTIAGSSGSYTYTPKITFTV